MDRPTRIIVFGVISLVFGGVILLNNLQQLGVAIGGPDAVDVESAGQVPGPLGDMLRDTSLALKGALTEPLYRAGLGLKSLASAVMACLLIAVGVGLMRSQPWSLRLARIWALYAIASALFITVMQAIYLVPHIPLVQNSAGAAGAQYVGMGFMFIVLCVFPILLIKLLPSKAVREYLSVSATADAPVPLGNEPIKGDSKPATQTSQTIPPDISPQQTTWRNDPWDDASSK